MSFSYDEDPDKKEDKTPPPGDIVWSLEIEKIGHGNFIHVKVIGTHEEVDKSLDENVGITEVYGFLRLPNEDYLKYLRERIQKR